MSYNAGVTARQLWGPISTQTGSAAAKTWCTPLILPTGGIIILDNNFTTTITGARATFKLPCNSDQSIISPDTTGNSTVIGFSEPFYASISPQIFALATATVISYVLVILIFITPRTFYVGGQGGAGGGYLSRSGLLPGYGGPNSIVGVGRRPLLQKIATLTVAVSLTIASADTFRVAEHQYYQGYLDSSTLVQDVVDSLEIRIVRVISDTFLWLAQVQTLIRLFPRHKEKVAIKWLGFAMVSCDTIFSILDSFLSDNRGTRPRSFQDAIPALNYLFDLAISLIYASCVVYYSLSKRRFAFWHPKMRNICLVALISYMAIAIPVVFFVLDISLPNVAGWGEYIRWVGAAAASVVVWEWVERIEALERDERKDGILGREIFDGDEMLDQTPSENLDWQGGTGPTSRPPDVEKGPSLSFAQGIAKARAKMPLRRRRKRPAGPEVQLSGNTAVASRTNGERSDAGQIAVPPNAVTPPSRSDTASAASTVYAVRYHNLTSPSPAIAEHPEEQTGQLANTNLPQATSDDSTDPSTPEKEIIPEGQADIIRRGAAVNNARQLWQSVSNPFKRRRAEPPAEVAGAQLASGMRRSPIDRAVNLKDRIGAWGIAQKDRLGRNASINAAELPVIVIPVPKADQRTWSPDELRGSVSTTGAGTGGLAPGDRSVNGISEQAARARTAEDSVVVIPAPINGRTWSPQEAVSTGNALPAQQGAGSIAPRKSKSSGPERAATSTPRGVLTIEESPRASGSASGRRSTYARPVSISPIAERINISGHIQPRTSPEGVPTPTSSTPAPSASPGAPRPSTPTQHEVSRSSPRPTTPRSANEADTAALSRPSPQRSTVGEVAGDGRNTGGTSDSS